MDALQAFCLLAFLLIVSSASGSTSVESLLDQLRKKQIQGMIAEQNKASTLKLPEKLAEASFNEAKMRALKANGKSDELNATPYSPFDAEKGPKNLGYLGRGYDVLHGDPLDDAGRVDPGFRLPAISLEYLQNVFSPDGEYRMPDNADVVMEPSALFSSTYNEIRTVSDYKQTLTEDVKTTSGFGLDAGFVSVSGEFTQSKSYQNAKENMKKGGTVNIDIIGRATVYKARLHTFGDSLKVSPVLQKAIENLPSGSCVDGDIPKYLRLIQSFGTHYTSVVTMGAKAVQRLSMGSAESLQLKKLGITTSDVVSLTVGLRAKGISASATYGKETSKSSETTKSQHLSKMDIQRKEFYIGGEPPSEASSFDEQGSTTSLRQWGRSAFERPVPIQYELRNIDELFQQSYLPKVTNLDEKKKCVQKALRKYCSKIAVDKQDCVSYEDGSDEPNAIRYGDFISLKRASSNNYLTVKEDFPQFKADSTEQLMKVVPVDRNAAWKYGKALHYGEPFNLVSEYGGENGVASCGSGQNKQLKLFSYGKVRITCSKSDNPVGKWTLKPRHWCQKQYEEAMVSGKLTPRECQAKCLELTNGECQAVQWLETDERCYYCSDTKKIAPFDKDQYIYFRYRVYERVDKHKLQERTVQIATLYFASPAGKKEGEIVLGDDKVYIGVNSYEERKPLFDVHRPAFLKVESGDVSVVEDDFTTSNAQQVSACSSGVNLQGASNFLACNFWWQVKSTPKALRTYPNIHYEQLKRVQQG